MSNLGGQKRTIFMPCGKTFVGVPREANNKALLHRKYCQTCSEVDYKPSSFDAKSNDFKNVKFSRNGNISKSTDKIMRVVAGNESYTIKVDGVSTVQQSLDTLKEVIQIKP